MKKVISFVLAIIMLLTVFVIPGGFRISVVETYADEITENTVKPITKAKVTFNYDSYSYTGKARKPYMKVVLNSVVLKKGVDYKVSYKNNVYPGKATVTITGINNYSGKVKTYFNIAKVYGLKTTAAGSDYVKLSWKAQKNVSGYRVYTYSGAQDKWVLKKKVKAPTTKCTIDNLLAGKKYMFMVKSYVGNKYSSSSSYVYSPTKPSRVDLSSFTTTPKLTATVKWKKKSCTGYQVLVSRYSDFDNAKKYTIKSNSTLSKKISGLSNGKYYYVKVRAYKTYKNKTAYGAWSKYKKIKTSNNGWLLSNGKKYYYKNGKPLVGSHVISGNHYYFSKSAKGKLMGADYEMWEMVRDQKSKTNYLIAVSRDLNRTCVYYKKDGVWTLKYYWKCTTGEIGIWTPRGSFSVPKIKPHLKSFGDSTYVVWYATRFKGACYFHSVLYRPGSKTKLVDGRLGQNLSHGCVRLKLENAKWIYDNIDPGTRVVVY